METSASYEARSAPLPYPTTGMTLRSKDAHARCSQVRLAERAAAYPSLHFSVVCLSNQYIVRATTSRRVCFLTTCIAMAWNPESCELGEKLSV